MNKFEIVELIYEGLGSEVYLTRYNNKHYILKIIKDNDDTEIQVLNNIKIHKNIINIIEYKYSSDKIEIVLPCAEWNLYSFLKEVKPDIKCKMNIFLQICEGLNHIHNEGYCHSDIKTDNIVIFKENDEYIAKIIDFGISIDLYNKDSSNITVFGTYGTISPQAQHVETLSFIYDSEEVSFTGVKEYWNKILKDYENYKQLCLPLLDIIEEDMDRIKNDIFMLGILLYNILYLDQIFNWKYVPIEILEFTKDSYSYLNEKTKDKPSIDKFYYLLYDMLYPKQGQRLNMNEVIERVKIIIESLNSS